MTVHSAPARPRARRLAAHRGAALLVVIVSIAILTAIAVDLAYSTRVSLLTAANARDELRAQYLARSAVQLSRLVLKFQQQLDGPAAALAGQAGIPRVQLWNLVPVSNAFTDGLFGGEREGAAPAGNFTAKLEDEGRKVNMQMDGLGQTQTSAQIVAFLQLVGDPRWDPLFDREDANGQRTTRTDLACNLRDWTNDKAVGTAISLTGGTPVFEDGFGDKNAPYSRGDDPYKAKSARFDSLDELYLVAGIDDDFMDAFRDRLTVYLPVSANRNVNSNDPDDLLLNARIMAEPGQEARLSDPTFRPKLLEAVRLQTLGGILAMTPKDFAGLLGGLGLAVSATYQSGAASGAFTDRSVVYRIRATGAAGAAERHVDAIVTFDQNQIGQGSGDTDRLLHWRED